MRAKNLLLLAATAILTLHGCGSDTDDNQAGGNGGNGSKNTNKNIVTAGMPPEITRLEFPHLKDKGSNIVVVHKTSDAYGVNYAIEWDINKKSQRWSCYQMRKGYQGNAGRYDTYNGYPFDPVLEEKGLYLDRDYFYRSGFDHGHVCPSADRQYSYEANKQTFYLSNMQPQYNKFNAGIWEKLESKIRKWTPRNNEDTLYVCKGGTIDDEENIIKRISGKLIAPKYFFCALLLKNAMGYRAIGFWMENENIDRSNDKLKIYAKSIDELEKITGIDFFCNLPDNIEDKVEASVSTSAWGLN